MSEAIAVESVRSKLRSLAAPAPKPQRQAWSLREHVDQIRIGFWCEGKSPDQLAKEIGCTPQAVWLIAKGLSYRGVSFPMEVLRKYRVEP